MFGAVVNTAVVLAAVTFLSSGCDSGSPTQPQPQPVTSREVSGTIAFGATPARHKCSDFIPFRIRLRRAVQVRHLGGVDEPPQSGALP